MRLSVLRLLPITAALALAGCHSTPPPPSQPASAASSSSTIPASPASVPNPSVPVPQPQHRSHQTPKSSQEVAQLDLNSEGGVRDGSYALWVHVTRQEKPLKNVQVIAFNEARQPVAAARTNDDGDAMLKVHATTYRVAARQGHLRGEKTLTYHPGDQLDLPLQP